MSNTPSVLLVEDNPDDEILALRALRRLSPQPRVVIARDGEEALAAVNIGGEPFDYVLLDIKLPKLSGLEVLRQMRKDEALRETPVAILTSSDEPYDIELARTLGAKAYIKKPLDYDEYLQVVGSAAQCLSGADGHPTGAIFWMA